MSLKSVVWGILAVVLVAVIILLEVYKKHVEQSKKKGVRRNNEPCTPNFKCTRKQFFNAMSEENVQCQVHYVPVYWMPVYRKMGHKKGECPVAEEVYSGIMSIPLYPKLTDDDVNDVITAVKKLVNWYHV